ncbi:MAG: hypothetical protein BWY67_01155 [Bacteroidetes bacterium ADurb.Bin397]|jgi:hypothetical protein|nr:MAG: hypothetical protein BWY67_01155 [Bacteroidetes bacterium ADurb.Bin397]
MDTSNFSELWKGQKAEQPAAADILVKINNYKRTNRIKILLTNIILIITSLFMIFIWYYYQPQFLSTKIGIVLIILAMGIFVYSLNQSLGALKDTNAASSNQEYLKNLLTIKGKQQYMQTTMLNLYFVLLSTGIALYMYEQASHMSLWWAVFAYGLTALWILFNWFYLRPKQIKKQQSKINEMIAKVENLQSQLKQE